MAAARKPVAWRPVTAPAAAAPARPSLPPDLVDAPAFIATVGPDLTRLIGARVSLCATDWPEPVPDLVEVARLALAGCGLRILLDEDALEAMIEAMFGGALSTSPRRAKSLRLAPSSGTWVAAARLIGQAIGAGLAASGQTRVGEAQPGARILASPADCAVPHLWFDLLVAGRQGMLALASVPADTATAAVPEPVASPPPGKVQAGQRIPDDWRARAVRLVRAVDVAVGVRIAELSLPLAEVVALRCGSILPIEPPATLGLTVEGVAWQPPTAGGGAGEGRQ
ncbi:hypothetical protein [Thermaurantiacus sp.]